MLLQTHHFVFQRIFQNLPVAGFDGLCFAQSRDRVSFLPQDFGNPLRNVVIEEEFHEPASAIWLATR